VPPPSESTKNSPSNTGSTGRESTVEGFRSFLRQADKLIKEGLFDQAKEQLSQAKKIDPANPFIIAFEERIRVFENKKPDGGEKKAPLAPKVPGEKIIAVTDEGEKHQEADREQLEQKLRHKIETEYKTRFTQELRKAEEHTAKILEEERSKLEAQQQSLKSKYDQQLSEAQHRLEEEYRKKMEEEMSRAEQRLQGQFQSKLALVEQETKAQLVLSYEEKQLELQQKLKHEQEEMLEQERRSFEQREKKTKEQFDRQLLEALRKTETVIREQSVQQQQLEKEQLRQQLTMEMQESLHSEREAIKVQYDAMKVNIEQAFVTDQQKLKEEHQRYLEEQLAVMKKREAEEFEKQRTALRQELENEYKEKLKKQLAVEREKLQQEAEATIEQEKKRLHEEHKELVDLQEDKVRKIRIELQKEMEQNFLKRMEQISNEYDSKMELLGTKIPELAEDKQKLYREKMRQWYINGQPTVDDARKIMGLKELLELSFDEHLSIEADVRLDLYVENVEKEITAGRVNLKDTTALDSLKEQFRITPEESAKLEPYILSCVQRLAVKGRILLVDDDLLLLQTVDNLLTDAGFQVIPTENVSEALKTLTTTSVDLILSDIKFGESELDGFQFFIAVQAQPHLRKTPFVFMSSLRDGVIIRSGIQLGVDDYLTKPMDPDLLIAVIEGKLKRYRNFDRN
jgi:CheY-like chemotaxis protein